MSKEIYTISYFSRSTLDDKSKIKAEINNILEVANENNTKRGVTGALLYSGGYFIQVLEGPEEAVEEIFESIQSDPRHCDVSVINNNYLEKRNFGQWSMALAGVDENLVSGVEGLLKVPDDIKASLPGKEVVKLLSNLLQRYEAINK